MYSEEELQKYPYFRDKISEYGIRQLLDPLTGVVSRGFMMDYVRELIREGTPFTFAIVDLDNFKFINDTYGHHAGDLVLTEVARSLREYLSDRGVVGRFGGDEFLFVDLVDRAYDEKKRFMNDMYVDGRVLRRNISIEGNEPFITATVGCATYPDNADTFETLFETIDKTLYRGKTKGRNCYIIYVEEKHKHIEIQRLARSGVCTCMQSLVRQFELVPTVANRLRSVLPLLMEQLNISDLYIIRPDGHVCAIRNPAFSDTVQGLERFLSDDFYSTNRLEEIEPACPSFYEMLIRHEFETVLLVRVAMDMKQYGYLMCAEARTKRIWQEEEQALVYFLAKLLATRLCVDQEELPVSLTTGK
ncbi:MAG: GGDEF domain-containing protein [Clostridia bacterium]|nr:GGDEF domain-containing protein [Clostridia bacterium]